MTPEKRLAILKNTPGISSVNRWQKHGRDRAYFQTPKLNGGYKWNGGQACQGLYMDLTTGRVHEGRWAGAKTSRRGGEIIENLAERLEEAEEAARNDGEPDAAAPRPAASAYCPRCGGPTPFLGKVCGEC